MQRYLFGVAAGALVLALGLTGCPTDYRPDGGEGDGGGDAGADAGCGRPFCVTELESADGGFPAPIAATLLPNDTLGVAYYFRTGTDSQSNPIFEIRYRSVTSARAVSAPETIDVDLVRYAGLGIATGPGGEPSVSYLGGHEDAGTQAFWFQNDAYLATRTGAQSWNDVLVAQESNEATGTPSPVSNLGFLVGLHSSVAFDGTDVYVAWRDCHSGQFPLQDWAGSDLEVARGTTTSFPEKRIVIGADGNTVGKQGYGGHNQLLVTDGGQVLIAGDQMPGGADTIGVNPSVYLRNSDATWTNPVNPFGNVGNTQLGPTMAWDPTFGFGIAVFDASSNLLKFNKSMNPTSWNTAAVEQVVGSGTSGWYPSLAIDPAFHEPHIAYYHCDNRSGISPSGCRTTDDELRIIARISNQWRSTQQAVVDPEGGWMPKLFFLSTGKRAVVYRDPRSYAVKVAVEQ